MFDTERLDKSMSNAFDQISNEIAASEVQKRLEEINKADNPLLEAARPLLRVAADMHVNKVEGDMQSLREMIVREVKVFQHLSEQANIKREHILATRYCLCTCIDEFAGVQNWMGSAEAWASYSLLVIFHNETYGGEKFFQLLGRLAQNPDEHLHVIEVMYQIMGLGFEGRYKPMSDGKRQLETIRQRVRTILANYKTDVNYVLSPHWQGELGGRLNVLRSMPIWVTLSIFGLLIFTVYGWYKYSLLSHTHNLETKILSLGEVKTSAPPIAKPLNLSELLQSEIQKGFVILSENSGETVITFTGDNMFMLGSATVNNNITPTLDKVSQEINRVTGKIKVVGHTDNSPINTTEFPSNKILSEKRAQSVADYLVSKGVIKARITVEGKGDSEPVADNSTARGKAQNRRVEINVTQ